MYCQIQVLSSIVNVLSDTGAVERSHAMSDTGAVRHS